MGVPLLAVASITLTSSQADRRLEAIAAGPDRVAIVWHEKDKLVATLVDANGKLVAGPQPIADRADTGNVVAAWNGKSFTVAYCDNDGEKPKLSWNELG